jgi:hypothetical protein
MCRFHVAVDIVDGDDGDRRLLALVVDDTLMLDHVTDDAPSADRRTPSSHQAVDTYDRKDPIQ